MSNSPLVNYTKISPNKTSPRNHKIDTVTIHCVVGQVTVERLGEIFTPVSREASANYGIGLDGKIGMYVEEKDRSWCSGNAANDNRAITIEVASDTTHPYAVTDAAYKSLIDLLVDICKRNDIKELKWKADKSLIGKPEEQNMTVHRWFANKACPGEYLYSRHGQIASEVNARLGVGSSESPTIKSGDVVSIKNGATYYNGKDIPGWVENRQWLVKEVNGDRAVIDESTDGEYAICSPINVNFLVKSEAHKENGFKEYRVQISITDLNIRTGPGTNYSKTGKFTGKGVFTIVDERSGAGSDSGWGKLKSGAGWISLDYAKKI